MSPSITTCLLYLMVTVFNFAAPRHSIRQNASDIRPFIKSGGQGGPGGSPFDDFETINGNVSIIGVRTVNVSYGDHINSIQVTYMLSDGGLYTAPLHGSKSPLKPVVVLLAADEFLEKTEGRTNGLYVDQLTFTTLKVTEYERRVHGPIGQPGLPEFSFEGYIGGFFGRSGTLINTIGAYILKPLQKKVAFSGRGGSNFDENPELFFPPVGKVTKLVIYHGDSVVSIQAEYQLLDGTKLLGKKYGGDSGDLSVVDLSSGERITGIDCKTDGYSIDQITISTTKEDGTTISYGPFGKLGSQSVSVNGNTVGFFGREGELLYGFGIYFY